MHIAVNTRFLRPNRIEGTGRFTVEIFQRLVRNHPDVTFHFLFDGKPDTQFIFGDNVVAHKIYPPARHPLLWRIWFYKSLPLLLRKIKPDVFISPDGLLPKKLDFPTIPIIHDLNFLAFPEFLPKPVFDFYSANFKHGAKEADHIITVSEFSKRDIVERLHVPDEKISVTHNAVDKSFNPFSETEKKAFLTANTNGKPYFLYVGAVNPRKNLERTLLAFDAFASASVTPIDLYLAGAEMYQSDRVKTVLQNLKNKHRVHLLGWLSDTALRKWLAGANGFIYTSLYEGFGIPILEAFASGVPVLTANTSAMPEVGGPAAFYANPSSVESITKGLHTLLADGKTRIHAGFEQNKQFSWDKSAAHLWEVLLHVQKNKIQF